MSKKVSEPIGSESTGSARVTPFEMKHIVTITELAQCGLNYLNMILPDILAEYDAGMSKMTESEVNHIRGLVAVSGPESIGHFKMICQAEIDKQVERIKAGASKQEN